MIQEEKILLLVDLCARVPYHPKGRVVNNNGEACEEWLTCATFQMFTSATNNCRLYLRPMSSMTEEEKKQYDSLTPITEVVFPCDAVPLVDWLNSHYFDYRGLIEKGLALEAPEGMYKQKLYNMITEDYVSFETAKLLKEKGFDEKVISFYPPGDIPRPTLQMAMKWLREVHNIFIEISVSIDLNGNYHYHYSVLDKECKYVRKGYTDFDWDYEEAAEVAIKYCLENLI